jgi:hypothetical protein
MSPRRIERYTGVIIVALTFDLTVAILTRKLHMGTA